MSTEPKIKIEAESQKFEDALVKRIGRPIKGARKGQRSRISVDISAPTKTFIAQRAKASGRTLAREAEIMIEGYVQYENMVERTRTTIEEMLKRSVEAELLRQGFAPVLVMKNGKPYKFWAEPGVPGTEVGFVPSREDWFSDDDEAAPDPPPLPTDMAGSDLDRLYLVWVRGHGWKWEVAPPQAGPGNPKPEEENK